MILSVYYICIASLFAISFFPHYRIWGLNWWAYFPLWVQCGLLGIGVVIPVIMWLVSKSVHGRGGTQGTNSKSPGRYLTISPALCVLFGLVFYFLCARTHFLGDGYTLLSLLAADNPLIKPRELGESLIHIWVKWLVGGTGEPAALLSFQIVSIASGTLLVSFVAYAARRLFERNIDRILFLLGVSTGGYMLLYFGYVENYALFVLSVTVYVLTGLLALTNRVRRRLILPPLVLACLFHVLGFTLIPSAAYVLLADTKIGRAMSRLNGRQKALVAISLPAILSILFAYFYLTSYYFRFAFVPLMQNRFTVEGYTLFSLNHLLDYLNLLFLLAPAMPMVIAAVIRVGPKTLLKIRAHRYLFILVMSVLGSVFLLDPKLGMPRDWDLFSYAGVPLAVALFYTLLAGRTSITTRSAAVLSISLSLLVLIPRAGAQMSERIALAHLDDYRALDKIKNRNVRVMLGQYYQDRGREEAFQREAKRYERDFPEELTVTEALEQMYAGSYRQAAVLLAEVIEKNPLNWNAWSILGASYTRQKRLDSAMLCLKIADGLNPYNPIIYNNLGWAHFEKGEYEPAQEFWRRALKQDSLLVNALMGLDRTAWQLKNAERPCAHLSRGTTIGDPTVDLLRALGDCFLAYQDYDRARETYDEALRKGMDSTYFERLTKNFPQLSR